MINNKPIIGIVSKHYAKYKSSRVDTFIRDEVKNAILANGGITIGILPTNEEICYGSDNWIDNLTPEEKNNLFSQIELCDGIIFQGGGETDTYEYIIAKYCYENDIPVLGICAGQNIIVRALGGTTFKIPNPEFHNNLEDQYVHSINITPGSKFNEIVKTDAMMVNSRHNTVIDKASLLDKVAICPDGYPDVVEAKDKKFYMGVRFHPESLYKIDDNHNNIFKEFINACKK